MWQTGNGSDFNVTDSLEYFKSIKGHLSENRARIELFRFLKSNIKFSAYLLLGIKLFPYQEIALKCMFRKDFSLTVCARGFGKTFVGGVFCSLYALFEPDTKIAILAPSFKQSKNLFAFIDKFANSPGGIFFREAIHGKSSHTQDEWSVKIGTSEIKALPLGSGDKIRGFRANVILIDELLAVPPHIVEEVIKPFMVVAQNPVERQETYEQETKLIERGLLKEHERTKFKSNKLVTLTSASYKFEHLYDTYQGYIESILGKKKDNDGATYSVVKMSYKALPSQYYDMKVINDALRTMSEAQFKREYEAEFTDDSSGYFRMSQMEACSIPKGSFPSLEIIGDSRGEYVLAIDPNYKETADADHFAMCIVKLDRETKTGTVVHSFALAGATLKEYTKYLHYILTHFNIVYLIIDGGGADQVLRFANESNEFKKSKIELRLFESEFSTPEEIMIAKNSYDPSIRKYVHKQNFQSDWIRNANQELQANFQHRRIKFGSPLDVSEQMVRDFSEKIPINELYFDTMDGIDVKYVNDQEKTMEFIEHQTFLVRLTKEECAMIEVSTSPLGNQSFDLPSTLKNEEGSKRPRKDSYTALLLANWGVKCYFMLFDAQPRKSATFAPFLI